MNSRQRNLILPEEEAQQKLKRLTRRGFLVGGVAAVAAFGGYEWVTRSGQIEEVPWPQRDVLNFNAKIAKGYLNYSHQMPTFPPHRIGVIKPNGGEGLDDPIDVNAWKLTFDPGSNTPPLKLAMSDVQSLPPVQMITNFCCIEGWNTIVQWKGVRFADFLHKYVPSGHEIPPYVYMATPDEGYYVGLDTKSAMHPQTLLAWELNGNPLTQDHGAPLRLVIPVKYGVKNIKRIGSIRLTDQRPADYWAENGYDWFAGL
jgi:DMSO/TMAO reductase YedYZ molybdopterin-dependent catalytic subunit